VGEYKKVPREAKTIRPVRKKLVEGNLIQDLQETYGRS
jgi:hypothetical protein